MLYTYFINIYMLNLRIFAVLDAALELSVTYSVFCSVRAYHGCQPHCLMLNSEFIFYLCRNT